MRHSCVGDNVSRLQSIGWECSNIHQSTPRLIGTMLRSRGRGTGLLLPERSKRLLSLLKPHQLALTFSTEAEVRDEGSKAGANHADRRCFVSKGIHFYFDQSLFQSGSRRSSVSDKESQAAPIWEEDGDSLAGQFRHTDRDTVGSSFASLSKSAMCSHWQESEPMERNRLARHEQDWGAPRQA